MIGQRDEGRVQSTRIAPGEVEVLRIRIVGVLFQALLDDVLHLAQQGFDPLSRRVRNLDLALRGQERIMRVVRRVEQILMVQLTKDGDHQHIA